MFAEMIPAGIAIRGFYGEGSKVMGNFFQISNQYTLGWTEQGILDRIIPLIKQFIFQERKARDQVLKTKRIELEDKIFRDLGVLTHARILPSIEFLNLLSAIRMGVDLGFIPEIDRKVFTHSFVALRLQVLRACADHHPIVFCGCKSHQFIAHSATN